MSRKANRDLVYMYKTEENLYYLSTAITWTYAHLPEDEQTWLSFYQSMVDCWSMVRFNDRKILNWCPSLRTLYPVRTYGDGNCLLYAVSMYLTGSTKLGLAMRELIHSNMNAIPIRDRIRKRWQAERERQNASIPNGGLKYTADEWDQEWKLLVNMAAADLQVAHKVNAVHYKYLEQTHVFVLANVLRRPIIVLGEPYLRGTSGDSLEPNDFVGIYLPLLWAPTSCYDLPVVLAFTGDHFSPLMVRGNGAGSSPVQRVDAVPLVTSNLEMLRLHFLLPEENDGAVANALLQRYMLIREVEITSAEGAGKGPTETVLCSSIVEEVSLSPFHFPMLKDVDSTHAAGNDGSQCPGFDPVDPFAKRTGCLFCNFIFIWLQNPQMAIALVVQYKKMGKPFPIKELRAHLQKSFVPNVTTHGRRDQKEGATGDRLTRNPYERNHPAQPGKSLVYCRRCAERRKGTGVSADVEESLSSLLTTLETLEFSAEAEPVEQAIPARYMLTAFPCECTGCKGYYDDYDVCTVCGHTYDGLSERKRSAIMRPVSSVRGGSTPVSSDTPLLTGSQGTPAAAPRRLKSLNDRTVRSNRSTPRGAGYGDQPYSRGQDPYQDDNEYYDEYGYPSFDGPSALQFLLFGKLPKRKQQVSSASQRSNELHATSSNLPPALDDRAADRASGDVNSTVQQFGFMQRPSVGPRNRQNSPHDGVERGQNVTSDLLDSSRQGSRWTRTSDDRTESAEDMSGNGRIVDDMRARNSYPPTLRDAVADRKSIESKSPAAERRFTSSLTTPRDGDDDDVTGLESGNRYGMSNSGRPFFEESYNARPIVPDSQFRLNASSELEKADDDDKQVSTSGGAVTGNVVDDSEADVTKSVAVTRPAKRMCAGPKCDNDADEESQGVLCTSCYRVLLNANSKQ